MAELMLEPYSVVQRWVLPPGGADLAVVLKAYLEALAGNCQAAGDCVIGHIKALALFPGQQYLRLSVVAAHLPATMDGAAPPGCSELEITLNVLVYGLERNRIEQITRQTARNMAEQWKIEIT